MTQVTNGSSMKPKGDLFTDALHIFVLFSFALAQPLFDLLSRNAEFFVARRSQPIDVIFLILILCVLLPTLVVLVEVVAGLLGQRVRRGVHGFIVAGLVAGIVLPALKQVGGVSGTVLVVGAVLFGMVAAIGYARFHPIRMFLTVLSPAVLIFPGLFLFNSPVFKVVFAGQDPSDVYPKVNATAPVVMVIFDEFSVTSLMDEHRQIDPIRYPNFAALARDATWFRNATTVSCSTLAAVPAILSGLYPDQSRLATAADYPHNLFALLGSSYSLKVFGMITQLCPDSLCERVHENLAKRLRFLLSDLSLVYLHILLPTDLSARLPSIAHHWMNFAADAAEVKNNIKGKSWVKRFWASTGEDLRTMDRFQQFVEFVNVIDSAEQPTLYLLHILLPHLPYSYLPSGKSYRIDTNIRPTGLVGEKWSSNRWAVIQGYQRYLLQVGFVDTLLGKLLARLKAVGLYDRSLIIVTADHGVSFHPNGFRRPLTKTNFQDIMSVPLFIKVPNQHEGVIGDRNVETTDILPTVADILGIRLLWPVDGHSAFGPPLPERKKKVVCFENTTERVFDSAALVAKYVTLKRKLALFGSGAKPGGLFKIGPYNELVGRSISRLVVAGEVGIAVDLDQATFFADVDPEAAFVPAHITGSVFINVETADSLNLAVAVNGTIRAVTRTFDHAGSVAKLSVIVPETAFQAGRNDVEVFVVYAGAGGQPRLVRTERQSAASYSFAVPKG